MEIRSLGFRTDLALREYAGAEVTDRGTHLVVRTPDNPTFWWGNFLLLPDAPADEAAARGWLAEFEQEFPDAKHRTFGVDRPDGSTADLAPFEAIGLGTDGGVLMTASAVHPPARPNTEAVLRPLAGDDDWEQQVRLSMAGEDFGHDLAFCTARARGDRRLVDAGRGRWYGAFLGDRLVSSMGLFQASEGVARFQNVKTHPDARGQGIAGTLVHEVARYGLDELGAHTLVMVADPSYLAIRIYRSVGFADTETQLEAERKPTS
jgi:ribosomal protein S18 acetylase RimI-like enzyme